MVSSRSLWSRLDSFSVRGKTQPHCCMSRALCMKRNMRDCLISQNAVIIRTCSPEVWGQMIPSKEHGDYVSVVERSMLLDNSILSVDRNFCWLFFMSYILLVIHLRTRAGQAAMRLCTQGLSAIASVGFLDDLIWILSRCVENRGRQTATLAVDHLLSEVQVFQTTMIKARGWCQTLWLGFGWNSHAISQKSALLNRRQYS